VPLNTEVKSGTGKHCFKGSEETRTSLVHLQNLSSEKLRLFFYGKMIQFFQTDVWLRKTKGQEHCVSLHAPGIKKLTATVISPGGGSVLGGWLALVFLIWAGKGQLGATLQKVPQNRDEVA